MPLLLREGWCWWTSSCIDFTSTMGALPSPQQSASLQQASSASFRSTRPASRHCLHGSRQSSSVPRKSVRLSQTVMSARAIHPTEGLWQHSHCRGEPRPAIQPQPLPMLVLPTSVSQGWLLCCLPTLSVHPPWDTAAAVQHT